MSELFFPLAPVFDVTIMFYAIAPSILLGVVATLFEDHERLFTFFALLELSTFVSAFFYMQMILLPYSEGLAPFGFGNIWLGKTFALLAFYVCIMGMGYHVFRKKR